MKKILLTISSLFLIVVSAVAAPVGKQQALSQAQSFMKGIGRSISSTSSAVHRAPRKAAQSDESYYYVFNVGNDNGFVIVSGDDRIDPIIGYSDTGSFDAGNLPDNAKAFLEEIAGEIEYVMANNLPSQRRKAETAKRPIAPMLTSAWGQGSPYNTACPTDVRTSATSVTGCVATAMAQVLYYHRDKAVKTTQAAIPAYSYTYTYNSQSYTNSVAAVESNQPIDWDNMVDKYSGVTTTDAQNTAVANLMAYCGKSVRMSYKSTASGAYSYNVAYAFRTYFGFDANTAYRRRAGYSIAEWNNMLYDELKAGRPIYYSGSSSGGGHAFVLDGMDEQGLYHVNWGWNGSSNGYFLVSVLNPGDNSGIGASTTNDGYSMDCAAIFGAQPAKKPGEYCIYEEVLSSQYASRSGLYFTYYFYNYTGKKSRFDCGIAVEDADGNLLVMDSDTDSGTMTWGGSVSSTLTASTTVFRTNNLPAGDYRIVPVSRLTGNTTWYKCTPSTTSGIVLHYDGSSLTSVLQSSNSLTAVEWDFPGLKIANVEQKAVIKVKNTSSYVDSNAKLYLYAKQSTTSSYPAYVANTAITVGKQDTAEVALEFTPTSAGTWDLKLSTSTSATSAGIGTAQVTITEGGTTVTSGLTATYNINHTPLSTSSTNIDVYDNSITGTIMLKNSNSVEYKGQVALSLWKNTSGSSYSRSTQAAKDVVIPAGGTVTLDLNYPNLDYGIKYWVRVHYGSTASTSATAVSGYRIATLKHGIDKYRLENGKPVKSIEIPSSSAQVTVDDQTVALNLTGTNVTKVSGTPGANFLLFLGETDAVPSGAESFNIVRNGTIAELNLVDNAPFFVPEEFTATKITYTRTPSIATNGNGGWETMVIPFAATKVINLTDGVELDWFRSATDTGKDFWLRRFTQIDGNSLTFEDVDEPEANEPLIIAVPDNGAAGGKADATQPKKAQSLQGKQIQFQAENAVIPESKSPCTYTSTYTFLGTYNAVTLSDIHTMNAAGTAFEQQASATVQPFRCYYLATNPATASAMLPLQNVTTGITLQVNDATDGYADIFTIGGMKVGTVKTGQGQISLHNLPKGMYIVNGKKIVLK